MPNRLLRTNGLGGLGSRGAGKLTLVTIGATAAILAVILVALEFPAYLLAVLFAGAAIVVFHNLYHHPYGVATGIALVLLAAFFGLDSAGLTASLNLVKGA